jgi:hypothetical protein
VVRAATLPLSFLLGLGFAETLSNFCGHEREAAEGGEPHDGIRLGKSFLFGFRGSIALAG